MNDFVSWYAITDDYMQKMYKWVLEGEYKDKKFEIRFCRSPYSASWTVLYKNEMVRVFGFEKYKDALAFVENWAPAL